MFISHKRFFIQCLNKSNIYSDSGIYFLVFTWMVEHGIEWQAPVLVLSIYQFDSVVRGTMFIKKLHRLLDKMVQVACIPTDKMNMLYIAITTALLGTYKEKYYIHLKAWHHQSLIKFSNFGTWCLKGLQCLFHSFYCVIWHTFEPMYLYEPSLNTDKHSSVSCSIWCSVVCSCSIQCNIVCSCSVQCNVVCPCSV